MTELFVSLVMFVWCAGSQQMNHGQSMNVIAQIAHLLGETTPRMYLCQVRDDTGQCSVCRHIPSSLLSQKNDVANYWVCGILSKLTHVFGE